MFCLTGPKLIFLVSLRDGFVLPGGCAASSFHSTPWRFSLAPRARSGRSGCASSAALRPALACDREGTARCADPRRSPPSHETLGRGQRFHPPAGRSGPARSGGMAPVARGAISTTAPLARNPATGNEQLSCARPAWAFGLGERYRRCRGWQISPEPAGPGRASRVGETAARPHANAEGAPMRIAPSGRGWRSVRLQRLGRRKAAPSHPRDRQRKPSRSDKSTTSPRTRRAKQVSRQWKKEPFSGLRGRCPVPAPGGVAAGSAADPGRRR